MKKKGFTLIELLAVVVILGIISVIATPIVLDVVDASRRKADEVTAGMILSSARNYYAESLLDDEKKAKMNGQTDVYDELSVHNKPKEGTVYIQEQGLVALVLELNNACYVKTYNGEIESYDLGAEECELDKKLDDTIPTVEFDYPDTDEIVQNGWYRQNPYISVNVIEEGSGFSHYVWCEGYDCTPDENSSVNYVYKNNSAREIAIDSEKTQICVVAFDNANNRSGRTCSKEISLDTTAPRIEFPATTPYKINEEVDLKTGVIAIDETSGIDGEIIIDSSELNITKAGTYTVYYTVYDKAGNKLENVPRTIIMSPTGVPTIKFEPEYKDWINSDFYVGIQVADQSGHGINEIKVCIDEKECNPTASINLENAKCDSEADYCFSREITKEGINKICVMAIDGMGQENRACSGEYKLDKTAPTIGKIKIDGSTEIKDWYTKEVTIETIAGTDEISGHLSTTTNVTTITETTDVEITTKDKAGNVATETIRINIDNTKPKVEINQPDINGTNGWYIPETPITITATITDTISGVDKLKWCQVVGENCNPTEETLGASKNFELGDTPGTKICVVGVDKAGNESKVSCSDLIKVDTKDPNFYGIHDETIELNEEIDLKAGITADDATSGIDGEIIIDSSKLDITRAGDYEVYYTVYDKAGRKTERTRIITVATDAPTVTFTPIEKDWTNSDFVVGIQVKDNSGHGINEIKVCIDDKKCTATASVDLEKNKCGTGIGADYCFSREITKENINIICVTVKDNFGTEIERCSGEYKLDKTTPVVGGIKVNGSTEIKDWYTEKVTIETVDGTDSISGHLSTTTNVTSITETTDVIVTTKDKAGNISTQTIRINIDMNKPTVSIKKSVVENQNVLTATITPQTTDSNYTYQWYKDGEAIVGAVNTTLKTSEAGDYKIIVTTGAGNSVESEEITVHSYKITYDGNGVTANIESTTKVEDIKTNITLTEPTRDGYDFVGWGISPTDTSVDYAKGATYTANENKTLYAIWKKTLTATFIANGATINKTSATCEIYNAQTECNVISPDITGSSATPTVVGFNTTSNATTSTWDEVTTKAISGDVTYYAITKKEAFKYTITYKAGENVTTIGSLTEENTECTIPATYNGKTQGTTCSVKLPVIEQTTTGYGNAAWYNTAGTKVGDAGATITVSSSQTITAKATANTYKCEAGSYLAAGATSCTACPAGSYCPGGTYTFASSVQGKSSCPSGYVNSAAGSDASSDCYKSLTGGEFVIAPYGLAESCLPGTYCLAGQKIYYGSIGGSKRCPSEYSLSPTRSDDAGDCYKIVTATFEPNGATLVDTANTDSNTKDSCIIYNKLPAQKTCTVHSPDITRSGYLIVGFNTTSTATTSTWDKQTSKEISEDVIYYAITKKISLVLTQTSGTTYVNGNNLTTSIDKTQSQNYGSLKCTSSDTLVATCTISGDTITMKPGSKVGSSTITIEESIGEVKAIYTFNNMDPEFELDIDFVTIPDVPKTTIDGLKWFNDDFYVRTEITPKDGKNLSKLMLCTANDSENSQLTCNPKEKGSQITSLTCPSGSTASYCASREITTENKYNVVCVQATDEMGRDSAVICSEPYGLDKSTPAAPTITASDGVQSDKWHTVQSGFTLTFSGSSSKSGITYYYGKSSNNITTNSTNVKIDENTSGTTYYVKACNGVGTCSTTSSYVVKYDTVKPSKPTITRVDYNTFKYSATDEIGVTAYCVSTSSNSGNCTWNTTTSYDITAATTYYVWAKDAAGNISDSAASITSYQITRSQGAGTTLTTKYESPSGTAFTSTTYVLHGTPIYVSASANTGYTLSTLKHGSTSINSGGTYPVSASEAISSTATANTYTITLNNQSATTAGTAAYYEKYAAGNYTSSSATTTISKITVPTKTGYVFGGYYTAANGSGTQYIDASGNIKSGNTTFTANTTLYAKWTPSTTTKYVVKHWTQNLTGTATSYNSTNYTLNSTDNKTGTTASSVTLTDLDKTITGFTYKLGQVGGSTVTSTTILADGTREINLYYTRNSYTCSAGYYLGASATSCTKCEAGSYCPGGTYKFYSIVQGKDSCPSGYKNSAVGSDEESDCYYTTGVGFEPNGATISKTSEMCNIYYGSPGCYITAPTITREGFEIIGFNQISTATTAQIKSGETFLLTSETTYYAITKPMETLVSINCGDYYDNRLNTLSVSYCTGSTGTAYVNEHTYSCLYSANQNYQNAGQSTFNSCASSGAPSNICTEAANQNARTAFINEYTECCSNGKCTP